jgi:hypothetical protein
MPNLAIVVNVLITRCIVINACPHDDKRNAFLITKKREEKEVYL